MLFQYVVFVGIKKQKFLAKSGYFYAFHACWLSYMLKTLFVMEKFQQSFNPKPNPEVGQ